MFSGKGQGLQAGSGETVDTDYLYLEPRLKMIVAKSSTNRLVGTGFVSQYQLQLKAGF